MKPKNTLEQINNEEKVNAVISHDEESAVKDTAMALEMAEALIVQLPEKFLGRAEWLKRFGQLQEAQNIRRSNKADKHE